MIANQIHRTVDLNGEIKRDKLKTLFAVGDKNAHEFHISIVRDGASVDLTGCTARWYFLRADDPDEGTVYADGDVFGSEVTFRLNENCYKFSGSFTLTVKLIDEDGEISTVYFGAGSIAQTYSDTIIDPDEIIVNLDEIEKKIADIEKATAAANEAASKSPYVSEKDTWVRWNPTTKKYEDTGVPVTGPIGPQGVPGATYRQIPFTALAENWAIQDDGYYAQDIAVADMPDADGDIHLNVMGIAYADAERMLGQFSLIWSSITYAGGVKLLALSPLEDDLPLIAGVFEWVV